MECTEVEIVQNANRMLNAEASKNWTDIHFTFIINQTTRERERDIAMDEMA